VESVVKPSHAVKSAPPARTRAPYRSRGTGFRARVFADDKQPSDETNWSGAVKAVSSTKRLLSTRFRQKRKRNAGRRKVCCPHASGVRDAPRRKAACAALRLRARSPAGVPPQFSPAGLSSRRLSVGPGFPKTAPNAADLPPTPPRSQRSTSRAGIVWRFRSPHHFCRTLVMRTSEPKPH